MHKKHIFEDDLTYTCKSCKEMTTEEIEKTADLFSNNYGKWSKEGPRPGKRIVFSSDMVRRAFVDKDDRFVAMVYHQETLVGHAFYMRRNVPKKGNITWILQLVVKENFRGHNIGTKLMHSIWQLSDSFAWGLYTSNPRTIKALENATMRTVEVKRINKKFKEISPYLEDVLECDWIESYSNGMVNTHFFVEHGNLEKNIEKAYSGDDVQFPFNKKLPEGYEWLAIVFDKQKPCVSNEEQLRIYSEYSESNLVKAYSKMDIKNHAWARHTDDEVGFLMEYINRGDMLIDVGCGIGRLSNALADRGVRVKGVDFSEEHISKAQENKNPNASFTLADARRNLGIRKYNAAICMYDVVGSFPEENDNLKILKMIYRSLKPGGVLIMSVMNMILTKKGCLKNKNVVEDINIGIDKLLKLKGTNAMQGTGDIFDGKFILVDDSTGICYRKEQFFLPNQLPQEYVIRDRRYTKKGIMELVQRAGFRIEESYYFQAGRLNIELKPSDSRAKEILVIARKPAFNLTKSRTW